MLILNLSLTKLALSPQVSRSGKCCYELIMGFT